MREHLVWIVEALRELVGLSQRPPSEDLAREGERPLLRIRRVRFKLALIAAYAATILLARLIPLHEVVGQVVVEAIFLFFFIVGVRSFRGKDEPVNPPRAWWRATAKPTAGFWLAGFSALGAWQTVAGMFGIGEYVPASTGDWIVAAIIVLDTLLVASFYLHSSVRLASMTSRTSPTGKKAAKQAQEDAWREYVLRRDAAEKG